MDMENASEKKIYEFVAHLQTLVASFKFRLVAGCIFQLLLGCLWLHPSSADGLQLVASFKSILTAIGCIFQVQIDDNWLHLSSAD